MSVQSKMTAIANAIRSLLNIDNMMGLDMMASYINSILKKTSDDMTVNGATITAPQGYYSKDSSKSVETAEQAIPSVSIDSDGLITASATQTSGYVSGGTKSTTKQLTVQGAKTITPGTANQTAVASGVYTTGAITVAGDADLVAANIKSGVSIFGVAGTLSSPTIHTGSSTPASSLGSDGDIYFVV